MTFLVERFFSVPVVFDNIDASIINDSLIRANKFIKDNNWDTSTNRKTITTYHSDPVMNYLGRVDDTILSNKINMLSREFLELIGIDPGLDLRIESWLNLNTPGTYHDQHEHFGSIVGGVVYLEALPNSGDLVFWDPVPLRTQTNALTSKNRINSNQFNYQIIRSVPTPGKIVMFESWVRHSVEINKSDSNRISIAFNIYEG
jgi:uncharacterized protein (TIGR02466 family)